MIATDGVVTLRAPRPGDVELLVAGRDEEFFKWFGPGATGPRPVACVWVDDELVGWVDYDRDPDDVWLGPGEVNVGYYLFPTARGKGYASRAVSCCSAHLSRDTEHTARDASHPPREPALARPGGPARLRAEGRGQRGALLQP